MIQGPRWTEIPGRPGDTLLFWIRSKDQCQAKFSALNTIKRTRENWRITGSFRQLRPMAQGYSDLDQTWPKLLTQFDCLNGFLNLNKDVARKTHRQPAMDQRQVGGALSGHCADASSCIPIPLFPPPLRHDFRKYWRTFPCVPVSVLPTYPHTNSLL